MNKKSLMVAVGAVAVGLGLSYAMRSPPSAQLEGIKLPASFSAGALAGKSLFDGNCAVCHGRNASGSESGPPLVHITYEPNHHSDVAFYRAAQFGVRRHHWSYGDMPPVRTVTREDVAKIVGYVRELQRANGIN